MRVSPRATLLFATLSMVRGADGLCADPGALKGFTHQIAYARTEDLFPFEGLATTHVRVWKHDGITGFYVQDRLKDFTPAVRLAYVFEGGGLRGGGTCPVQKDWRECLRSFVKSEDVSGAADVCEISIDVRSIPAWQPSPDSEAKRRVASELRSEIEGRWPGARKIVIRDFNLEDNQLTMYVKTADGDVYQGCGFDSAKAPHCEGWHLFGQAPVSQIRKWILERPYRLK